MIQKRKRVCVLGLGQFGRSLALALARHCDVLAIDRSMSRINGIADKVQRALCIDGRDYDALSSVISSDFDEAVVSIGEELEASILCTLHLKRIGIPILRAKANTMDHAEILRSVGATEIIFPELETAEKWALKMLNSNLLDFIPLADDYRVMDITAPSTFHKKSLIDLHLRNRLNIYVIAVKRGSKSAFIFMPAPDFVILPGDVLVLIGREDDILQIDKYTPPKKMKQTEKPITTNDTPSSSDGSR